MGLSEEIKDFIGNLNDNRIYRYDYGEAADRSEVKEYTNDVLHKMKELAVLLEKAVSYMEKNAKI